MMNTVGRRITQLREKLSCIEPLPAGVASFVGREQYTIGLALFPCGTGLLDPDRSSISTIVLGSDWGNEESHRAMLSSKEHRDEKLFLNLRKMMERAGFDLFDCFFSNAWPVLRAQNMKESGHHAMRNPGEFTERCRAYLSSTIACLKPRLVVTLGVAPAWFLGPNMGSSWSIGAADKYNASTVRMTCLPTEPVRDQNGIVYVALTHQSIPANVRYRGMTWELECDLLRRAREFAKIPRWV